MSIFKQKVLTLATFTKFLCFFVLHLGTSYGKEGTFAPNLSSNQQNRGILDMKRKGVVITPPHAFNAHKMSHVE